MKNMNCLNKILLVSLLALPSTSSQLCGMSYLSSLARKAHEKPLQTGLIGLAALGLATFHPAVAEGVKTGFNLATWGIKKSLKKCKGFINAYPLPMGLIGLSAVGMFCVNYHSAVKKFLKGCGDAIIALADAVNESERSRKAIHVNVRRI